MPDSERVISPEETHNPEGALPGDGNESTRSPHRNLGQRIYEAIHIKDEPGHSSRVVMERCGRGRKAVEGGIDLPDVIYGYDFLYGTSFF